MSQTRTRRRVAVALALAALGAAVSLGPPHAVAERGAIGINVLLRCATSDAVLSDLGRFGTVLDVIPEIRAVMLRADESALPAIQTLPFVAAANPDRERRLAGGVSASDFAAGANAWNLDAIDVTDAGGGRTVPQDGTGVYIGVFDSGLVGNWREYFPEARIATQFARSFSGGGGERGNVSEPANLWEHDTVGHGTMVTSIILGFRYAGPEALPPTFNGVAPKATVIPVKVFNNNHRGAQLFSSVWNRGLVYLANLKASGALGGAPLVVNMSVAGPDPDAVEFAAIDYAIAQGVVIVAGAGNDADLGVYYPAAYPPVISVADAGWVRQLPPDDPTTIRWIERDVPESDASQYYIFPASARALAGQDLDVAAPGTFVPAAFTQSGRVDYSFFFGTSAASPHVAGIAALMLQKNPALTQAQVESILESTALPIAPGAADLVFGVPGRGKPPTWSDHDNVSNVTVNVTWGANATGHGLARAAAALAAVP